MSNLSYTRELGVWNAGVIRAAELADLDQKTVKAPNFDGGGSYAPSSAVYVGGAGMQIRLVGDNVLAGALTVAHGSGVTFETGTVLVLDGQTLVTGTVEAYSGSTWTFDNGSHTGFNPGSFLSVHGQFDATRLDAGVVSVSAALVAEAGVPTTLGGALTVTGTSNFNGDVNLNGLTRLEGPTVTNDVTVNSTLDVRGDLTLIGGGTFVERLVLGAGASGTYSVSTADVVFIANWVTGGYTYHVDAVGAVEGKRMRFCLEQDCTATVQLMNNLGVQIGPTILRNNSTGYSSMEIMFIAGVWRHISFCRGFAV